MVLRRRLVIFGLLSTVCAALVLWLVIERQSDEQRDSQRRLQRRLFPPDVRDSLHRIELTNPAGRFVIERHIEAWRLVEPIRAEADATTVDGILDHVFGLEQEPLDRQVELTILGLDPPTYVLDLISGEGRSWRLAVGKRNTFDDTVYVRRGDADTVGLAPAALLYQVATGVFQLRERRVFPRRPEQLRRVEISLPTATFTVVWDDDGAWVDDGERVVADPEVAHQLRRDLAAIRVASFSSDHSDTDAEVEGSPMGRVAVEMDGLDGTRDRRALVLLGPDPDNPEQLRGRVVSSGSASSEVLVSLPESTVRSLLVATPSMLRDRRVIPFEREMVFEIRLRTPDRLVHLKRVPKAERDGWQMVEPARAEASDAEVFGLLYRLWTLRFEPDRFASPEEVPEHAGLAEARRSLTLVDREGREIGALFFGLIVPEGVWVRGAGGRIGMVPAGHVEAIAWEPSQYVPTPGR